MIIDRIPSSHVAKFEIVVDKNNIVHSKVSCGDSRTFEEVRRAIELARDELNYQLSVGHKCPMASKTDIVYTIGDALRYEEYFNNNQCFGPNGTPQKDIGGTVWKYRKEAERFVKGNRSFNCKVYAVKANWDNNVSNKSYCGYGLIGDLTIKADLVKL